MIVNHHNSERPENKLTRMEIEQLIRIMRGAKLMVEGNKMQLEERHAQIGDGYVQDAILQCENELILLKGIIRKLWIELAKHNK